MDWSFKPKTRMVNYRLLLYGVTMLFVIGFTLAFFFDKDFASNHVGMSGKVDIEAVTSVGGGVYNSIEDTSASSNLVVKLDNTYTVLIPGMDISIPVSVRAYRSTTKPLLRAKLKLELANQTSDMLILVEDIREQMDEAITNNGWVFYPDDSCYYYISGNAIANPVGNTILHEVDVTNNDVVIPFIVDTLQFPTYVTSALSGSSIRIVIVFEAIQNYIPDASGNQIDNTIINSKIIFDESRNTDKPGVYIDGVKREFTLEPGKPFSQAIAEANTTYTPQNSCGWFADKDCTIPISSSTIVTEDMRVYTKEATLDKLNISGTTLTSVKSDATGEIVIPANITAIGTSAFGSNVTNVIIPNSVISIGQLATMSSKIINLHIPASVTSINSYVGSSPAIQKITVDPANTRYIAEGNCLIDKQTKTLILGCKTSIIPNDANIVTAIGGQAFRYNSGITTLHIPANISSISGWTFTATGNLKNVSIDSSNPTYILKGNCLIQRSNRMGIVGFIDFIIPNDGSMVGINSGFCNDSDYNINLHIPSTITEIRGQSFFTGNLASITVDPLNTKYYSVNNCIITRDTNALVLSAKARDLYIPNSVIELSTESIVSSTSVKNIVLPNSCTTIQNGAFYYGSSNQTLFIPASVTNCAQAFGNCNNFTIYLESASVPATWNVNWNKDVSTGKMLTYKTGYSLAQYKAEVGITG